GSLQKAATESRPSCALSTPAEGRAVQSHQSDPSPALRARSSPERHDREDPPIGGIGVSEALKPSGKADRDACLPRSTRLFFLLPVILLLAVQGAYELHHRLNFIVLQLVFEGGHRSVFLAVLDGLLNLLVGETRLDLGIGKIRRLDGGKPFAVRAVTHGAFLFEDGGRVRLVRGVKAGGENERARGEQEESCKKA